MRKADKYVVIYLDSTKKNQIIVRPTEVFIGDWKGLVHAATMSNDDHKRYHSYEIK